MNQKHCLLVMAFAGVLSLAPLPAFSGNLSNFSDALEQLADMTRAADRAHDALNDAMQGGRDYSRYDRDWRNAESRLERARIRTMAHIAGVSESRIRSLRDDGYSWERIARKYKVDPRRLDTAVSLRSRSDKWKGVPPGLAKKGGLPPGQAKKFKEHHDKKHRD
ncbi:MAG: hypothetical protein ACLR7Z_07935 [Bilophila wadsworthia]